MEPEGPLTHSQEPATCPYPESPRSSPYPRPTFRKSILILSSHIGLGFISGLFSSGLLTKTLCSSLLSHIRATCLAHVSLLDLITRMIRYICLFALRIFQVTSEIQDVFLPLQLISLQLAITKTYNSVTAILY